MEYALLADSSTRFVSPYVLETIERLGIPDPMRVESYGAISNIAIHSDRFSYFYLGNEFCEHRLPSLDSIKQLFEICSRHALGPVLVTPPVTDFGIGRIQNLFDGLGEECKKLSIVVNDLGLSEMVAYKYPEIRMIAGRVLDKTSHDSRASLAMAKEYYGDRPMRIARTPSLSAEAYRLALDASRFERFEFDLPMVGLSLDDVTARVSLYWPYSYLTTGRVCRSRGVEPASAFPTGLNPCSRVCGGHMIGLDRERDQTRGVEAITLYQDGNTVFYLNPRDALPAEQQLSYDRIVIQL